VATVAFGSVQNSQKMKGRGELVALARGRKKARVSWDLDLVGEKKEGKVVLVEAGVLGD
jgi:hypothetical protein